MYKGIDVSEYNGTINWQQVKADGVEVAILRSVKKNGIIDGQFENNYAGCRSNGIAVGVYKYSYAKTANEAAKEANEVLELLHNRALECKVWLDMEDISQRGLTTSALTSIIKAFRDVIINAGYEFGIYCNLDWYNNVLDIAEISKFNSNWWIARYGKNTGAADYTYKPEMANIGWQYTSAGTVPGINGNVDLNEYYAELDTITEENTTTCEPGTKYSVGQRVRASSYYASSTETDSNKAVVKTATGTITRIAAGARNPYLLDNGNIGWVNDGDIREVVADNVQVSATSVQTTKYGIGQKVRVSSYYASSTEMDSNKAVLKNATGTITRIAAGTRNPYLLDNGNIGWCNDGDIREIL